MSNMNFDPMINAELCGQLLGLNKTRKKENLWDHFVRCINDTNGATMAGAANNVARAGTYDRKVACDAFYTAYKNVHPGAEKIARKKLRGLMMSNCSGNAALKSIMGMQALNPTKKLSKRQLLAMCCIGPKKVMKMQAKGILLGFDNYPDCSVDANFGGQCSRYGGREEGYDIAGLQAVWEGAIVGVNGMNIGFNNAGAFLQFAQCFYDIPRQNALRKELAMIILKCFGEGNSGLNGLLKLRQLKGGKDASSMDMLISSCLGSGGGC